MVETNLLLRQRMLLRLLNEQKGYVTGETLGKQMRVSDRTIRKDVLELNRILKNLDICIQSIRGKGHELQVKDKKVLDELLRVGENFLSREDRVRYLTMKLISSNGAVNLSDFEDEMFISRTTLERDLQEFKSKYVTEKPYLALFQDNGMIWLEDNEIKKRIVINNMLVADWNYSSKGNIFYRNQYLDTEAFDIISTNVNKYLRIYNIRMDDPSLVYFIFMINCTYENSKWT
ncbi:HTH domain-containing protein [Clostridium sp. PL3]|uniref:HTH domain-containing protein n=1 Tax=Clostridium thailandense TaxID=2794346 RepID=A0A949U1H7_9CLOT|nr:HTH domain-containing protein [Clostridium thailandense]MBV7275650.1 HTH domain-containing protein [Clostridium thailandense]